MFVFYLILLPIFLSIYRSLSTTNPTNMSDPDAIRDELERRKRIRAETIAREEAEDAALLTQWRAAETAKSQTRMRVEQVQREREQEQVQRVIIALTSGSCGTGRRDGGCGARWRERKKGRERKGKREEEERERKGDGEGVGVQRGTWCREM
jgi:hypothetical protein